MFNPNISHLGGRTKTFVDADISAGYNGFFDPTTTVPRKVWYNDGFSTYYSDWSGYITGHTALFRYGGGASGNPGSFQVSVDGGPFKAVPNYGTASDGVGTLFRGLSDRRHFVQILNQFNVGGNSWTFTTGTVFTVTGGNPQIDFDGTWTKWMVSEASFPGTHTYCTFAHSLGANVVPASTKETAYSLNGSPGTNYNRIGSIKFNATCTEIALWTGDSHCYVSIDGAAPIKVYFGTRGIETPNAPSIFPNNSFRSWKRVLVGLDGSAPHDYYIFPGYSVAGASTLTVGIKGTFNALGATKKVIQFGTSITQANVNTNQANCSSDIFATCAALGALGVPRGKSGQTAAGYDTDMNAVLASQSFIADIAIIELGANDTAGAAFRTSYTSDINKVLANGTNKIICRGNSLGGPTDFTAIDADINTCVTNIQASLTGAQAVVFQATTTWTGITKVGLHPTEAGYQTLANYAAAAYPGFGFF